MLKSQGPQSALAGKTFIDLFAGLGGFHLAMESLGMQCSFSSEWDKHAAAVYHKNFGLKPAGDITKIEAKNIPSHFMICGGFPCQAFSISGSRKGFKDTRGTLFFEIARIAEHHRPRVLFLENVRNFEKHDDGKTLQVVKSVLQDLGYTVFHKVVNAAAHGFPTARQRIYIVAFHKDLGIDPMSGFEYPQELSITEPLRGYLETNPDEKLTTLSRAPDIDKEKSNPTNIAAKLAKNPSAPVRVGTIGGGGQGDRVYSIDGPAITLSAYGGGNAAKTGAYWINGKARKLTPRECANIMGFPANYKIADKPGQAYKQFGNSVVVGMIRLIGEQIEKALEKAAQTPAKKRGRPRKPATVESVSKRVKPTASGNPTLPQKQSAESASKLMPNDKRLKEDKIGKKTTTVLKTPIKSQPQTKVKSNGHTAKTKIQK